VLADESAMRRAALNVIGDAIRLTDPGGQVIVSTALGERGEVALRVRDTGAGMTPEEVRAALIPLGGSAGRAVGRRQGAPGLGLPLTKALVEANRGSLQVTSGKDAGTLVEMVFPPGRVLAG
jgi:signal transduction histidine kinase